MVPEHNKTMDAKPVIILGMHRSGTSCLAGSLEQAGLYLGQVNTKARYNPKGNRENRDIMDLNDRVLSSAGGSWDNPPSSTAQWSADQIATQSAIIATYPTNKIWGFKEPRTLLTLEGWLDALPDARLVGTFRHPMAVAQSLCSRNKFPIEQGIGLWKAYNERLLQISQRRKISMMCFDWAPQHYSRALSNLSVRLDLTPPPAGFNFFESVLRSDMAAQNYDLPSDIGDLFHALEAIAD